MFRLYIQFLSDADLLGKTSVGIDGSKFKDVNSRKDNYNQQKIDKHKQFIEDKTNNYLQELDELDKEENTSTGNDLQIKKEQITKGLARLNRSASCIKLRIFQLFKVFSQSDGHGWAMWRHLKTVSL